MKEIERGKLEKFGKWRNHSVELARISFVDGSRKRILPQMTFVVPFSPWYRAVKSRFSYFRHVTIRLWILKRRHTFPRLGWMIRHGTVARLISTRIIMHNLIFWNYIRFEKVRDLKYIFKRELITFQFIEHIIIKSCNVTLPNVSLIKATWQ